MEISRYNLAAALIPVEETKSKQKVAVPALLFYSGTHRDSAGREQQYPPERLERIAENSNKKVKEGIQVKLFKDHKYTSESVIGVVKGFFTKELTEENLPFEGMRSLIGQTGLFAEVTISGEENVVRYKDGRFKSLSAGINLNEDYIYEASVVPFPALAGASLYQAWAALHGTTLRQTEAEQANDDMRRSLFDLWDKFFVTLMEIDKTPDGDKVALKRQLVQDFAGKLEQKMQLPSQVQLPLFEEKQMPENQATYDEKLAAQLEEQKALFAKQQAAMEEIKAQYARERAATNKYHALRRQADDLLKEGKLTPANYEALFAKEQSEDEAIATYSQVDNQDLAKIEYHLQMVAQFSAPVKFGKVVPDWQQPGDDGDLDLDPSDYKDIKAKFNAMGLR